MAGTRVWWRGFLAGAGAFLIAGTAPASGQGTGSVAGSVRLRAAPESPPPMLSPYARPRYRPPARTGTASDSPESVVVYLIGGPATGAVAAAGPARVVQRDRTILPRVTAVQAGARVDFPNDDDVFHNLFSLSVPHRFNLGRYPPGESRSERFDRPGVVRMFCDIHSEMSGVILVLDTPHFARPDARGGYRIEGLPPGEYGLVAWHEVAGADTARVVVAAGAEAVADFVLGG